MARLGGGDRLVWLLVILLTPHIFAVDNLLTDSDLNSVRWLTSKFGRCSVECGEGIKERTVRCVRTENLGGKRKYTDVPAALCSLPSPHLTQPCSNQCTGRWVTANWSECSETCGTGTQTREVKCDSSLVKTQRYQATEAHCTGYQPESSRKCHITDCIETDKEPSILSENYTLIQLRRADNITVTVGGQVNIFPGQTVEVKCPVKYYSKDLVYWSRGYRLVPFMGRVRSIPGGLQINQANPGTDAGVYTCIVGYLSATVTVQFINKDDPLPKIYKKTIQKSKRQHKALALKENNTGQNNNRGMTTLGPNQQGDQSKKSANFRMYATLEWSPCNATCGSAGLQQREVSCFHVTREYVKIVPESECSELGFEKPEAARECSTRKNCGVWRSGPWTLCQPSCGHTGHMSRILTCEWESTGKHAWEVCDLKSKPVASKSCTPRPCPSACTDDSRYCNLVIVLKLCKYHHFRQECCRTCQALSRS